MKHPRGTLVLTSTDLVSALGRHYFIRYVKHNGAIYIEFEE